MPEVNNGGEVRSDYKEILLGDLCGDGILLYRVCDEVYMNKMTELYKHYTNINFLGLIFYCNSWGKLGKTYTPNLCIIFATSCETKY